MKEPAEEDLVTDKEGRVWHSWVDDEGQFWSQLDSDEADAYTWRQLEKKFGPVSLY